MLVSILGTEALEDERSHHREWTLNGTEGHTLSSQQSVKSSFLGRTTSVAVRQAA